MSRVRSEHGFFISSPEKWKRLLAFKTVAKWYGRLAGEGTKRTYMVALDRLITGSGLTPEQFLAFPSKKARDVVWDVAESLLNKERFGSAKLVIAAARHFYRYHRDEKLEFDSRRGGRHYISARRQKVSYEIIPDQKQMYALIDSVSNWRDKAILLILFQSGIRINALCHLNYGHVAEQLKRVPIRLRITSDIDTKLRGMDLDYYYTFIGKESGEALNRHFKAMQTQGVKFEKDTPLFMTMRNKRVTEHDVWRMLKRAAKNAGLNPKGIWIHCLRKAFRKVLNASPIDEDTKEAIMGHKLPGVRGNYFDLHDIDEIERKYMKCNFSRVKALSEEEIERRMKLEVVKKVCEALGLGELTPEIRIDKHVTTVDDEIAFYERLINKRKTEHNGGNNNHNENNNTFKIITEPELIPALEQGYEIVKELSNGKIVVKKAG